MFPERLLQSINNASLSPNISMSQSLELKLKKKMQYLIKNLEWEYCLEVTMGIFIRDQSVHERREARMRVICFEGAGEAMRQCMQTTSGT